MATLKIEDLDLAGAVPLEAEAIVEEAPAQPKKTSSVFDPSLAVGSVKRAADTAFPKIKKEIEDLSADPNKGLLRKAEGTLRIAGDVVTAAGQAGADIVGGVAKEWYQKLPKSVQGFLGDKGKEIAASPESQAALQAFQQGMDVYGKWKNEHPRAARDFEAALAVGSIIPVGRAAKVGAEAVETVAKGAATVADDIAKPLTSKLAGRAEKKAAEEASKVALLEKRVPDATVATKKLENGVMVADKTAKDLVKQGISEADVALIKQGTAKDKQKMLTMLDTRLSQLKNKRVTARATDTVGDSFLEQAKFIENINKTKGKELDGVAANLAGEQVDMIEPLSNFADDLGRAGVTIRGNKLDFTDSIFEGLPTPQTAIQNAWKRAQKLMEGDALDAHNAKQFIDEIVDYADEGSGLKGRAENILKGLRHDIDTVLDTNFEEYNKVNSILSETYGELDKINEAMGRKFKTGDTFANAKAGTTLRRILSNTQSRTELLGMLDSLQAVAKKHGMVIDEDIITQANFADVLEKLLGTEAPTSFLGQSERALEGTKEALGAMKSLSEGKLMEAGGKAATAVINKARGKNQEKLIEALKKMLKEEAK